MGFDTLHFINFQVRTYKKQIEEAEEIAALNLAKFRKTQVDLQDSLERAVLDGAELKVDYESN